METKQIQKQVNKMKREVKEKDYVSYSYIVGYTEALIELMKYIKDNDDETME